MCAICADDWGRGVSFSCHECTDALRGFSYFLVTLASIIMLVIVILLAIYLVRLRRRLLPPAVGMEPDTTPLHRRPLDIPPPWR